jgi:hypothetical protein
MAVDTEVEKHNRTGSRPGTRLLRWIGIGSLLLVAVLAVLFAVKWPFTRHAMIKRLEHDGEFQVTFGSFHSTYFPPGCVAEDVSFRRASREQNEKDGAERGDKNTAALLTVRRLTIQASYSGLLSHPKHVEKLLAEGARANLADLRTSGSNSGQSSGEQQKSQQQKGSRQSSQNESSGSQSSGKQQDVSTVIDELLVRNSVLVLDNKPAYQLDIHELRMLTLDPRKTIPFSVTLHATRPDAEIRSDGWIGPEAAGDTRKTPLSGSYQFQGELGVFKSITGKLSSRGQFHGTLANLQVEATTESPDFGVKESSHRMRLDTRFRGTVDLRTGEIRIPDLKAKLGSTNLEGSATIAARAKNVQLNVARGQGDVQDLLNLFSHDQRPPMAGPITFATRINLPSEPKKPFKERVLLLGDFKIDPARFTSGHTQFNVDKLSAKAQGETKKGERKGDKAKHAGPESDDPNPTLSDLKGHVELKNGVASFSRLSFSVPGATANMAGTYNLVDKRVDLHGRMSMQASLSQATTGVKSFFLKILDPFFKKKHAGAVIPVAMTGSYGHTHFSAGPGK